jgi:hypothetical protein
LFQESDPSGEGSTGTPDEDLDRYRTETQKEWAAWAAHGYRKLYQPRSIQRFGLVFTLLLSLLILTVFWLAAPRRLP